MQKVHINQKPIASREAAQLWELEDKKKNCSPKVDSYITDYQNRLYKSTLRGTHRVLLTVSPPLHRFAACGGFRVEVSRRDTRCLWILF